LAWFVVPDILPRSHRCIFVCRALAHPALCVSIAWHLFESAVFCSLSDRRAFPWSFPSAEWRLWPRTSCSFREMKAVRERLWDWMKRGSTRWAGHPSPSLSFMLVTLLRKLGCARFGESSRWVEAHPCGESSIDRHRALVFFPSPPWPRCMRRRELALLSLVGA